MQGEMWAFAEIAFGLACSCFPILPRLYQHVSAVAPYTAGTAATVNPATMANDVTGGARGGGWHDGRKGTKGKSEWVHLNDKEGAGGRVKSRDEESLEGAVDGR